MPVVAGGLLVMTQRLNFKRLRDPYASYPRARLLTFNLLWLAFFALAFFELYEHGENFPHRPVVMALFLFLGPLPFAANALYLALPSTKTIPADGQTSEITTAR
jgi:hypothetical protein